MSETYEQVEHRAHIYMLKTHKLRAHIQAKRIAELEHDMQELARVANERNEHMEGLLATERTKVADQDEQIKRLREALKFYSENSPHSDTVKADNGGRAQAALKESSK